MPTSKNSLKILILFFFLIALAFSFFHLYKNKASKNKKDITSYMVYNPSLEKLFEADGDFLMLIEDIFYIPEKGTNVTGKIGRGTISVGENVDIVSEKKILKSQVSCIDMFNNENLTQAVAGQSVGICLTDIQKEDLERGQALVKPGTLKSADLKNIPKKQ